jgi:hypothetical protein
MRSKLLLFVAGLTLVGMVTGGIGLADVPLIDKATTVEVLSKNQQEVFLDLNAAGSQGDMIILSSPVYRNGVAEGRIGLHITVTSETEGQAVFSVSLPEGQITAQGLFQLAEAQGGSATFAVTGGTRKYQNVRGYVDAAFVNVDKTRLTFELIP